MTISVHEVDPQQYEQLFPLLLLAEPSLSALQWSLANLSDTVYAVREDDDLIAAATMRWQGEPAEIVELAVASDHQRMGFGRQIIEWLIAEAIRRGKQQMIVGTANSSIDNIIFYQRCGFRMDHVRKDYFWYYRDPVVESGLRVRDMLVFRYEIGNESASN